MTEQETTARDSQLVATIQGEALPEARADSLLETFQPFFNLARPMVDEAGAINVTAADQLFEMRAARDLRLRLVKVRTSAERARKEMKDAGLREGRAIDNVARVIRDLCAATETTLLEAEQFAERAEAKRMAENKAKREEELGPWVQSTEHYDLSRMPEEAYQELLAASIHLSKAKAKEEEEAKAAEAKEREARKAEAAAERARVEKELAESKAAEEKVRAENERLIAEKAKEAEVAAAALQKEKDDRREEAIQAAKDRRVAWDKEVAERAKLREDQEKEKKAREAAEAQLRKNEETARAAEEATAKEARKLKRGPYLVKLKAYRDAVAAVDRPLAKGLHFGGCTATAKLRADFLCGLDALIADK